MNLPFKIHSLSNNPGLFEEASNLINYINYICFSAPTASPTSYHSVRSINSKELHSSRKRQKLEHSEQAHMNVENDTPVAQPSNLEHKYSNTMAQVLQEIDLYDDLYSLLESKQITYEALKFIKQRHIDELFERSSMLGLKIIFEHRILEWQKKQQQQHCVSLEICQMACDAADNCRLLSIKPSCTGDSIYLHTRDTLNIDEFAQRLAQVVSKGIATILKDANALTQHDDSPKVLANYDNHLLELNVEILEDKRKSESRESLVTTNKENEEKAQRLKPSNQIINNKRLELANDYERKRIWGIENDLREILKMYKSGNKLLKNYALEGGLTPMLRSELVAIIADHFVMNDILITVPKCRILANEICSLFPQECMDTYFLQEFKAHPPKGKLWDRYQNRRQWYKKLCNCLIYPKYVAYTKQDKPEMEILCRELKFIDDEERLLQKWNKTFFYRRYQLQTQHFSNWKLFFDEYPFCKQSNYFEFIDADLSTLYPNLKFDSKAWDTFCDNFKTFFWNRITHGQSRQLFENLIDSKNLPNNPEYVEVQAFKLLHAVLNSSPQTIEEAQRQFTVEVPDYGELKKLVIERKKYCIDNQFQCRPYIAVVNQEYNSDNNYSVVLDSAGYSCETYQEAIELCFKLYLFFDISFSDETWNSWIFIQRYFFNKHSKIKNPTVDAFILDIRAQTGAAIT